MLFALFWVGAGLAQAPSATPVAPATPTTPAAIVPKLTREVDIPATQVWTDTTVDLAVGERIVVESSGQVKYQTQLAGPQGGERTWTDPPRSFPAHCARARSL